MNRESTLGICLLTFAIGSSACYDDLPENEDLSGENFEQEFGTDEQAIASPLPPCGGYWTLFYDTEVLRSTWSNQFLYEIGPNCSMPAPGIDCGPDNDDMLSFYLRNHAENLEILKGKLRFTSTNWAVYLAIRTAHPNGYSARIYEQVKDGQRDNYNAYVCINTNFRPFYRTLRIRKF